MNRTFLVHEIRRLDADLAPKQQHAVIRVWHNDRSFDWNSLGVCTDCGMPGIPAGQAQDCRYGTDGTDGLHEHRMAEYSEFHVDRRDPRKDLVGHGIADTQMVAGAVVGGVAGLVVGAIAGKPSIGAMLGAGIGGYTGAQLPARRPVVFELADVHAEHVQLFHTPSQPFA